MAGVLHDWPEADLALWARLGASASLLDDNGSLSRLRTSSTEILAAAYGQWLQWLRRSEPAALAEPPEERLTMDRLRCWLDGMRGLRPMTRAMYVSGAVRVLSEAAPDLDWSRQRQLVARLRRAAHGGDPALKAGRVFDSGVLLQLGLDYARNHPKSSPTPLERATRFRTGTMIAMLAVMPMRARTFAGLELGTSVLVTDDRVLVAAGADLLKRGATWEADVPEVLLPNLREYLDEVRPWLMAQWGARHERLWVNDRGRPYPSGHLSNRIAEVTTSVLGVRVAAHLFRHAAATTLVRASPEQARLVTGLLGHTSLETAEKHYIHATSIDAGRTYAKALMKRKMR